MTNPNLPDPSVRSDVHPRNSLRSSEVLGILSQVPVKHDIGLWDERHSGKLIQFLDLLVSPY